MQRIFTYRCYICITLYIYLGKVSVRPLKFDNCTCSAVIFNAYTSIAIAYADRSRTCINNVAATSYLCLARALDINQDIKTGNMHKVVPAEYDYFFENYPVICNKSKRAIFHIVSRCLVGLLPV